MWRAETDRSVFCIKIRVDGYLAEQETFFCFCLCTLISTSQGLLPQQDELAGVTSPRVSGATPKVNAVMVLVVPTIFFCGIFGF